MKSWFSRFQLAALAAALVAVALPLRAQQSSAESTSPQLLPSPAAQIKSFEPAADQQYLLGAGDEISIDVTGRAELSGKHIIGPDGRITMPVAGDVKIADLTREQASAAITKSLSRYYSQASATVAVETYTGNRILVLGDVQHPGLLLFDSTPTLLEAITRSGMVPEKENALGVPERVAIYRGNDKVVWVQLREMLEHGSALADVRLMRGDIVYVPSQSEQTVSVLGLVQHPGAVPLLTSSTLADIIAQAGGLAEAAGSSPNIQIIDPASGKTTHVSFKSIISPTGALEVKLRPGDIIYVPASGFYKTTYVIERLNPLTTMVTLSALALH
jgi:polysaccharide export outer membrane protein